jgi:Pentapeptide repeats (8 copies)
MAISIFGADRKPLVTLDAESFVDADLRNLNLESADCQRIDLSGCDFRGSRLHGAMLTHANLLGANFTGCDLSKANFYKSNLHYATFDGCKLDWCSIDVICEILRQYAGNDQYRLDGIAFILSKYGWGWDRFIALKDPRHDWHTSILRHYVQAGDNAPPHLREAAK